MKQTDKGKMISFDEIRKLLHDNAEKGYKHTTYQAESRRFHLLMNGDMRAVDDPVNSLDPEMQGKLSKDQLRNLRYLFIINTALATRYMIEVGIPQETVYSISDVYIQRADDAKTMDEIWKLNREVWTVFVETVREYMRESQYSKPILLCMDYIDTHFNEKITLEDVAGEVKLSPCYLATLFKKETGKTFGEYLMGIRIETSMALLTKTDYSYSQIAYSLAFCSQSHFTKAFHKHTGYTPKQYRMKYYNATLYTLDTNMNFYSHF